MTTIYILADASLPHPEQLESLLKQYVSDRYPIEIISDKVLLQERLGEARQAVVFFADKAAKIPLFVQQCRGLLAQSSFVAVVEQANIPPIEALPIFEADCHFLLSPYEPFHLLNQLSAAVRELELLAAVSESGHQDEVTNLFNRSYLLKRLGEEISLSHRHFSPLCCVIIGINFYQMYLDSYGYDFINALLRHLADKISGMTRHEDLIARMGDDELAILLPRSTEKGAKIFTTRLVQSLNAELFKYNDHEEEISVCAGVSGYPLSDNARADADTIVRYGRHALHQARCTPNDESNVCLFSEINPVF